MKSIFKKEYILSYSAFTFFILLFGTIFYKENTILSLAIIVFLTIILIIFAVGPESLLNFILEQNKNGTKFSFKRHIATTKEIEFAFKAEDFKINELENQNIYDKSIKRKFEERSDVDFLIIATKLWREKELDKAIEHSYYGLYITKNDKIKSLLLMRVGTIYSDLKNTKLARIKYKEAIATDPQNFKALNNLAASFLDEKDFLNTEFYTKKALKINKKNSNTYNILGVMYTDEKFKKMDIKKSKYYFKKSINLNHFDIKPLVNMGSILLEEKNYKKAEKYLLKAFSEDNQDIFVIRSLSRLYLKEEFKEKDYEKAIDYLLLLKGKDNSSGFFNDLGWSYLQINKLENAKKYLEKAFLLDPKESYIADSLGELYMKLNDVNESEKYFKLALKNNKEEENQKEYKNRIITLYKKFNLKEKIKEIEEEFPEIKPSSPKLQQP